jgi:excisionase family DNA binding protein
MSVDLSSSVPNVPRIGLTREEAAKAMGVSVRTIDALIADRTSGFPVARIGTRVVIPFRELTEWVASQVKGAQQ